MSRASVDRILKVCHLRRHTRHRMGFGGRFARSNSTRMNKAMGMVTADAAMKQKLQLGMGICYVALCFAFCLSTTVTAFTVPTCTHRVVFGRNSRQGPLYARKTALLSEETTSLRTTLPSFDPLHFSARQLEKSGPARNPRDLDESSLARDRSAVSTWTSPSLAMASAAVADSAWAGPVSLSAAGLTPDTFQPVCPTSDSFYRLLQGSTQAVVGPENYIEYGPLIAGGLLRIRLELCVVESFFKEAVGPFIEENGLSWILPLHESVETFLAGVIFALATTFILIGSTKLLTVIVTYTDFLIGVPLRLLGGFIFDRAQGKPVTLDIGLGPFKTRLVGPPESKEPFEFDVMQASLLELVVLVASGAVNFVGKIVGLIREVLEAIDFFVGRYLVLFASFYILFKFAHFKIFPDFP